MKKIVFILILLCLFFIFACKEEKNDVDSDYVEITFNVDIPNPNANYKYIIYGSFSNWKANNDYILKNEDGKYVIKLKMLKDTTIIYKYGILDGENIRSERDINNLVINDRNITFDMNKVVSDTVEKFDGISVPTNKDILDSTFYDNDKGLVHTIDFNSGMMKVDYKKKENQSWACVIRNFLNDEIGKLYEIRIEFLGEEGTEYLFKLEGGDGSQEVFINGTGDKEIITIGVNETAINSKKFVIFGGPGKTGTNDEPLTGHYEIYSIILTLKDPDAIPIYTPGDNPIHILAIGNSFSDDGLWLLYDILRDLGYDDIILGNLYIGGCSVATHKNNLKNNLSAYTYRENRNGSWVSRDNYKASAALEKEKWDFISLQQASNYSGMVDHYVKNDIDYIYSMAYNIASVKNENVKFVWQMTWAYQSDSDHSAFPDYGKDQMRMYNGIVGAVREVIETDDFAPIIVPSGTTIQNLRTSFLGDTITRDGYHLNESYGRYSASLTWAIKLTGKSIDDVKAPTSVAKKLVPLCKEAAKNACLKPYEVTESIYKVDEEKQNINLDDYVLLDPSVYIIGNGYYNSQDGTKFLTPIQDGSDFCNGFITTKLFTRDDLPVGAVIVLEKGYQYRPEGWIDERRQTSRNGNTTEEMVIITEDWWSNYIYRAFNLSKVGGGILTGDNYQNAINSFKIYLPK